MAAEAKGWRELATDELSAEPDTKLRGELAAIFVLAILAMAPLPISRRTL